MTVIVGLTLMWGNKFTPTSVIKLHVELEFVLVKFGISFLENKLKDTRL
jgi:hypothetical protein